MFKSDREAFFFLRLSRQLSVHNNQTMVYVYTMNVIERILYSTQMINFKDTPHCHSDCKFVKKKKKVNCTTLFTK